MEEDRIRTVRIDFLEVLLNTRRALYAEQFGAGAGPRREHAAIVRHLDDVES